MVEMNLFVIMGGVALILVLISLVLFGIGFFVKAAKKILWLIALLLLIGGIYFIFLG